MNVRDINKEHYSASPSSKETKTDKIVHLMVNGASVSESVSVSESASVSPSFSESVSVSESASESPSEEIPLSPSNVDWFAKFLNDAFGVTVRKKK